MAENLARVIAGTNAEVIPAPIGLPVVCDLQRRRAITCEVMIPTSGTIALR